MFDSILVVCTGNLCRSPIGERLLKAALPTKKIDSAGIKAVVGNHADEGAIDVAQKHGLSLDGHCARQLTTEMSHEYDLILVMEREQLEIITGMSPELRGKTFLFGQWLDKKDVPDPYRKSSEAFEFVYQILEQSTNLWADKLGREK